MTPSGSQNQHQQRHSPGQEPTHSSQPGNKKDSQKTQKSKNFRPIISQSHPQKEIDTNTEISDARQHMPIYGTKQHPFQLNHQNARKFIRNHTHTKSRHKHGNQ
jgi:hypothetical protein